MPDGNISLDFSKIDTAATTLRTGATSTLQPAADAAQTAVNQALDNDLILPTTSPILRDKYSEFTEQLGLLIQSVRDFADQFEGIKDGMQEMDGNFAELLQNPQGS